MLGGRLEIKIESVLSCNLKEDSMTWLFIRL